MNYYQKYLKYKNKYFELKKMKFDSPTNLNYFNYFNNKLIGGMNLTDDIVKSYFTMYNLISWDKDKLFVSTNDELNRYCQSITTKNLCNPPYKDLMEEKKEDMCCVYNDKNIHKTTIHKFDYNSNIPSRDKSLIFKFLKEYDRINPQSFKDEFYDYIRHLCNQKIDKEFVDSKIQELNEILEDYLDDYDDKNIDVEIVRKNINSDDFLGLHEMFSLVYPNGVKDKEYELLKAKSDSKLELKTMQEFQNKLFEEIKDHNKIYHLYFSFGTLDNLGRVKWNKVLEPYIKDIITWISDPSINYIVLGGHSFGSFVIQKLGLELIKREIDLTKIVIVGSGCYNDSFLTDEEIKLFKEKFVGKYQFIINSYTDGTYIFHEHDKQEETNIINKINTHTLICTYDNIEIQNIKDVTKCDTIRFEEIIKSSDLYKSINNPILHSFANYSHKYFLHRFSKSL